MKKSEKIPEYSSISSPQYKIRLSTKTSETLFDENTNLERRAHRSTRQFIHKEFSFIFRILRNKCHVKRRIEIKIKCFIIKPLDPSYYWSPIIPIIPIES